MYDLCEEYLHIIVNILLYNAIIRQRIDRLLVNNSPSLLLLTTAWLDDDEATGLPVGLANP